MLSMITVVQGTFIEWVTMHGIKLIYCDLLTPHGDIDLGQLWHKQWLAQVMAWVQQAINWPNEELWLMGSMSSVSGLLRRKYH